MRQVVGYDRFEGEHAYRQLGEMYQALRLYVNCFQPSMKLQATHYEGRKVRRVSDAAKTPLQRLLLSKVLPPSKETELQRVAQVLDPLRLFHHLQDLQQALFRSTTDVSPDAERTCPVVLLFCIERCLARLGVAEPETVKESGQRVVIHAGLPGPVSAAQPQQGIGVNAPSFRTSVNSPPGFPSWQTEEERSSPAQQTAEAETPGQPAGARRVPTQSASAPSAGQPQGPRAPASRKRSPQKLSALTIEQAIQDYLEDQRSHHHRPKTIEWHELALRLFQHYLLTEHQCLLLYQITQTQVRGWLAFLAQVPTARGSLRSTSTVESYARSTRAFCRWLVHHKYLQATPFAHLVLPKLETGDLHPLAPEEWERLLLACRSTRKSDVLAERATAGNRAILWLLFDTGMRVSELCDLRLSDVDREQGMLLIRGKGSQARRLTLGQEGLYSLRMYLDTYRSGVAAPRVERGAKEDHLFLSERGCPLTKNGMALLFARLRKRTGIARKGINPSLLRESFALRFLQTGGDPLIFQELLGYSEQSTNAHFRLLIAQVLAQH